MKSFKIDGKLGKFEVTFPEELAEISNDYLESCVTHVNPAPNYAVVAIVYKDSLNVVLTSARQNKPTQLAIIPVFIKAGENDSTFIKGIALGDRVVISGSDLSMAHHINSPYNKITPTNIINICEDDKNITKASLNMKTPVCFVEFKVVPISAIHARLDKTPNNFVNPFVHKVIAEGGEA